jgi:hypothetical protein
MPRTNRRFQPSLNGLELRISLSTFAALDTVPPGGSHSAPIILEPVTGPPTIIVAVAIAGDGPIDPDPDDGTLPEPEPAPPPFPGGDPPLGWPPIPKHGPAGPA